MEELQLTLTPSRVDQRNYGIMLTNWRVGQTLSALVSSRMPSGQILLSIGGRSFVTSQDIPVQPGTNVRFEVQQLEPRLVLKLLDRNSYGSLNTNGTSVTADRTSNLGLSQFIRILSSIVNRSIEVPTPNLGEARALLNQSALTATSINAQTVQSALLLSGIFTEALWAANRIDLAVRSSKTVILSLRERITLALRSKSLTPAERESLSKLLEHIDSVVSSITNRQILSIPQEAGNQKWAAAIPLQWGGDFLEIDVEIKREVSQHDENETIWSFAFSLELNRLGVVTARIYLLGEQLRIEFEVSEAVSSELSRASSALYGQFKAAGLDINEFVVRPLTDVNDSTESKRQSHIELSV